MLNCWESNKCGFEPGGRNVEKLGVCPASVAEEFDGINGGKNGGRYCWSVTGTLCNDEVSGPITTKLATCFKCEFLTLVFDEEGQKDVVL